MKEVGDHEGNHLHVDLWWLHDFLGSLLAVGVRVGFLA